MIEKLHIIEQQYNIKHTDRENCNGHKSACLWFTGLSGSGKSTIANKLEQELFSRGIKTYVLDGDNIRIGLNKDLCFNEIDRRENIRRIAEVATLMYDAGLVVLAAFVSPFIADRQIVRGCMKTNFVEIYVDAPLEACEKRDVKGLYVKARAGEISNFTGITSPFEPPLSPDIHIKTDQQTADQAVETILNTILPKLKL